MSKLQQRMTLGVAIALSLLFASSVLRADDGVVYDGVKEFTGVVYKTVGDRQIKLNIFLPTVNGEVPNKPLSTLIYMDSGCWYSGEPSSGGIWRMAGALERGFAIVSLSHRSISEVQFPCQIEDVRAAVRFLRAHAEEYNLDKDHFAVTGASSGGNMSLCLGIPDGVSPFDVGENLDQSSQVQAVIDFFGPSDFADMGDHYAHSVPDCLYEVAGITREDTFATLSPEKQMQVIAFSPVTYVSEKYSPTLIFHGVLDTVVPLSHSAVLYDRLRNSGVKCKMLVTNTGVHDVWSLGKFETTKTEMFQFLSELGF